MRKNDDPVIQVLEAATQLISRPGGWMQHAPYDASRNSFCALGAIRQAATGQPTWYYDANERLPASTARRVVEEAIDACKAQLDGGSLTGFNDRPTTSADDIVRLFRAAIKHRKKNTKHQPMFSISGSWSDFRITALRWTLHVRLMVTRSIPVRRV